MIARRGSLRRTFTASFVILSAFLFAGCPFHPGVEPDCASFEGLPITPLGSESLTVVLSTPGTIMVTHGSGTAKLGSGKAADAIKVEQSVPIPQWANRTTVFLNGWKLNYLGGDQHVLALGTAIGKIRTVVDPRTREARLTWNALGLLRDDDGEEGYEWTYTFTVIAWEDSNLGAAVDHGVVDANGNYCADGAISDNYYKVVPANPGTDTALSSNFSFIQNVAFAASKTVAVLPRGFGFGWTDSGDHHLLQIGYNIDHSEILADGNKQYVTQGGVTVGTPVPTGTSQVGSGFVSWNTYAIFKDNDTKRDYAFGEVVSAMGGNDVGLIQPPFSIVPLENTSGFLHSACTSGSLVDQQDFVVENVPFEFAVPMLTGWELEYQSSCGDQHVKAIGISIDTWSYQPPSGGAGGTLRYTLSSVLHDDDNEPFFAHTQKVAILGFRPIPVGSGVRGGPAGGR